MGFYSIYKIIKDMIRTLFGKKFLKLFIIIIFIIIILFAINEKNVFALSPANVTYNQSTHNVTYNNDNYKINDDVFTMPYLFFYEDTKYEYIRIIASSKPFTFEYKNGPDGPFYNCHFDEQTQFYYYDFWYSPNNLTRLTDYTLANYHSFLMEYYSIHGGNYVNQNNILFLNFDIYDYTNRNNIIFSSNAIPQYNSPTLSNTTSELENLNFNNFIINANDYTEDIENNDGTLYMLFYNRSLSNSQNTDGLYPIKEKGFTKGSIYTDSESSTSDNIVFSFPLFMSGVYFNIGSTYEIRFAKKSYNSEWNTDFYEFFDNSYTFTISSNVTQDYINQINQQTATSSDSEREQDLQNSINQQTQSIDNINNTITDSTVDSSSIELPTDNTNDPTQSGVDNIFQTIYNSFTSGTAQDIVFPIPFTNKSIILPANYIYNSLNNNNASWIITIIQAFWLYLISRFIITDIMSKIRKIKQGNLDNIENSNIKEDML